MKKMLSGIVLGAVLISGVFFAVAPQADETTHFGGERFPPILGQSFSELHY